MKPGKSLAVVAVVLTCAGRVQAAPIVFSGSDPAATSIATMPNSVAARATFDAAAALLGSMSTIDFETTAHGAVPPGGTGLGGGVSLSGDFISVTDTSNGFNLFGDNTTVGGDWYASVASGDAVFSFLTPIQAFGAYFSGLQGNVVGQQTIIYTSGRIEMVFIPKMDGGAAFVGFTDAGSSISSVTIHFINDIVGVDDVRYGPTGAATAIPEPASLLLLGTGIAGFVARRRRAL